MNMLKELMNPKISYVEDFIFNENFFQRIDAIKKELENEHCNISNSCYVFLLLYLAITDLSEFKSITVNVTSNMPNGAGLGSSSSYIVSLAKALFDAFKITIDQEILNRWCFEMDKLFHGKPSGIDNSICTYGGALLFEGGKIIEQVKHESIPNFKVILVNTGIQRNTKAMIERCRKRFDLYPELSEQVMITIGMISKQIWQSLKQKDNADLSDCIKLNQNLLEYLDVGHPKISEIIEIAKRNGFVAKLTGAGGGGIVMIYLDCKNPSTIEHQNNQEREFSLIDELLSKKFEIYRVTLGVKGVTAIENETI
ncbi:hypothetical protein SSS_04307 [Sarcoptes scabiei]|nr:hypothetical protein SSS_04307 [Sarcoptes scabiei]